MTTKISADNLKADIAITTTGDIDVSSGTLTLANDQISGDKISGGTISTFASTGIDDNATSTAITIDSSQNVDFVGTVKVEPSSGNGLLNVVGGGANSYGYLRLTGKLSGVESYTDIYSNYTGTIRFQHDNGNELFSVSYNGDISFYEDTGTTPKMFWDASAERLGIGTTSPSTLLQVQGNFGEFFRIKGTNTGFGQSASMRVCGGTTDTTGLFISQFGSGNSSGPIASIYNELNGALRFGTNNAERMRIDSSGNVGIGTSVPSEILHIRESNSDPSILLQSFSSTAGVYQTNKLQFELTANSSATRDWDIEVADPSNNGGYMAFDYEGSEKMRINSSGRVGIGETSPDTTFHVNGGSTVAKFERDSGTNGSLTISFPSTRATFDASGDLSIRNGGIERVRFNSGGIISASQGIALGVGTARTASNVLDDYEEGTWTPTITRASVAPSLTTSNSGTYTKVGNLVTVWGKISISAIASQGTNVWIITSLPFVMDTQGSYVGSATGSIGASSRVTGVYDARVANYLYCQNQDGVVTNQNFQVGDLYFTLTYETT